LPWRLGSEHSVTLTLSAYNVKIVKDDKNRVGGVFSVVTMETIMTVE